MTWKPDVCIYHDNCNDGFTAAWAVWEKWGDDVRFIPLAYGNPPPPGLDGKNILILDFSFKPEITDIIASTAKKIVMIDHHKTAMEDFDKFPKLPGLSNQFKFIEESTDDVFVYFDMEKSGAMLAYQFCFGEDCDVPDLVKYVQDRDLWKNELPNTKYIHTALSSYPKSFTTWNFFKSNLTGLVEAGKHISRFSSIVKNTIKSSTFYGNVFGIDNAALLYCERIFSSDVGNELLSENQELSFVACWSLSGNYVNVSLRSKDDRIDVSELAKKYGGGGHRNASGFRISFGEFLFINRHIFSIPYLRN